MQSKEAKAFDLSQEPAGIPQGKYGSDKFGDGLPDGPAAGRSRRAVR